MTRAPARTQRTGHRKPLSPPPAAVVRALMVLHNHLHRRLKAIAAIQPERQVGFFLIQADINQTVPSSAGAAGGESWRNAHRAAVIGAGNMEAVHVPAQQQSIGIVPDHF